MLFFVLDVSRSASAVYIIVAGVMALAAVVLRRLSNIAWCWQERNRDAQGSDTVRNCVAFSSDQTSRHRSTANNEQGTQDSEERLRYRDNWVENWKRRGGKSAAGDKRAYRPARVKARWHELKPKTRARSQPRPGHTMVQTLNWVGSRQNRVPKKQGSFGASVCSLAGLPKLGEGRGKKASGIKRSIAIHNRYSFFLSCSFSVHFTSSFSVLIGGPVRSGKFRKVPFCCLCCLPNASNRRRRFLYGDIRATRQGLLSIADCAAAVTTKTVLKPRGIRT